MSLPLVIVFERHWDRIPKLIVNDLLPELVQLGYDTLTVEAPQDLSSSEIIERHEWGLARDSQIYQQVETRLHQLGITEAVTGPLSEASFSKLSELMRLYVSSREYRMVALTIRGLPASRDFGETCSLAKKLSVTLKGIDIDHEDFDQMTQNDAVLKMPLINRNENQRISTFVKHLLDVKVQQGKGVIFACGALHAQGLLAKLKENNLQEEVLYYFPHSSQRLDDNIDDIQYAMNPTLEGHTHRLTQADISPFNKRVIAEIKQKIKYQAEILDGNSHSRYLSELFQIKVKVFLRTGHHVDALVDLIA